MTHAGGCHCGRIRFEVDGQPGTVLDCNCSMCRKRGGLLWFVPREDLRLLTAVAELSTYTFNTHKLHHHFCSKCGIAPFSEGSDAQGNPMASVNVRCLEDVDIDALQVKKFDGRSR